MNDDPQVPLPPGFYAIHIIDEQWDGDDPRFCDHVGWHLIKVTKTGRARHRAVSCDGFDIERLSSAVAFERELYGPDHFLTHDPAPEYADLLKHYRECYGRFTGRCGICDRKLTDPDSLLRGIGPECAKAH